MFVGWFVGLAAGLVRGDDVCGGEQSVVKLVVSSGWWCRFVAAVRWCCRFVAAVRWCQ